MDVRLAREEEVEEELERLRAAVDVVEASFVEEEEGVSASVEGAGVVISFPTRRSKIRPCCR